MYEVDLGKEETTRHKLHGKGRPDAKLKRARQPCERKCMFGEKYLTGRLGEKEVQGKRVFGTGGN